MSKARIKGASHPKSAEKPGRLKKTTAVSKEVAKPKDRAGDDGEHSLKANDTIDLEVSLGAAKSLRGRLDVLQAFWRKNEEGYRKNKYAWLGAVYGEGLKLIGDETAQSKFYAHKYWKGTRVRATVTERDMFRDLLELVMDARNVGQKKMASKYAGLLIELSHASVLPDHAAHRMLLDGGIEKISRRGLVRPIAIDVRDIGDGMTASGKSISYHEDADEPEFEEPAVDFENLQLLVDHKLDSPRVRIEASWYFEQGGYRMFRIERVEDVEKPPLTKPVLFPALSEGVVTLRGGEPKPARASSIQVISRKRRVSETRSSKTSAQTPPNGSVKRQG